MFSDAFEPIDFDGLLKMFHSDYPKDILLSVPEILILLASEIRPYPEAPTQARTRFSPLRARQLAQPIDGLGSECTPTGTNSGAAAGATNAVLAPYARELHTKCPTQP